MNNNETMDALGNPTNSFIVSETKNSLGENPCVLRSDYYKSNEISLPYVFTRYLYSKEQVYHSLFLAILEKNINEALFWGYELYYSGFQTETMKYVFHIFEEAFQLCNRDDFCVFIKKVFDDWFNDKDDAAVGILIWNLVIRSYTISPFLERYFGVKCKHNFGTCENKKYLRIRSFDPTPYKTVEFEKGKTWTRMKQVCQFPIRAECLTLFNGTAVKRDDFCLHWLYFASVAPLWEARIAQHNGYLNHEKKDVVFDDDDDMEEFYELYGLEPDEQSLEIRTRCTGENLHSLSIVDFSKKYNGNMILKIKNTKAPAQSRRLDT